MNELSMTPIFMIPARLIVDDEGKIVAVKPADEILEHKRCVEKDGSWELRDVA